MKMMMMMMVMMMMMMMMMKNISLWTLQHIISSVEDGVSVLVLQLSKIIIIHKQLERAEDVVRAWRELRGENVVQCRRNISGHLKVPYRIEAMMFIFRENDDDHSSITFTFRYINLLTLNINTKQVCQIARTF